MKTLLEFSRGVSRRIPEEVYGNCSVRRTPFVFVVELTSNVPDGSVPGKELSSGGG